jgi:CheY-like chemotaxis protein
VLAVDDSAVPRAKLRKVLEGAGFRVRLAVDGRDALRSLAEVVPDVVLTDLEMPELDGYGLYAAIRADTRLAHLPVVAISGHDLPPARQGELDGVAGVFRKPWDDAELIGRLRALAALPA